MMKQNSHRMHSAWILGLLLIFSASQTLAAPQADVLQSTYNFTSIAEGTEITHDFIIRNKGTESLEISAVKTG